MGEFRTANLSHETVERIKQLEEEIARESGHSVVLVAYEERV